MVSEFKKRVPDEFGLIIPDDNGIQWIKQGGGFSCVQHNIRGTYIPIGKIKYNLGFPSWSPNGPNFEEKLRNIQLDQLTEEEQDPIPNEILSRGYFTTSDEYLSWIEESELYGWINLWDDLRRFTYGIFDNLDSDPRKRWDSKEDLWEQINSSLGFEYEFLGYDEYQNYEELSDCPRPQSAIRPIKITEGENLGKYQTDWSALNGKIAILLCPNAD
jgi:hypothetical protein